jgi:hypothetical protein
MIEFLMRVNMSAIGSDTTIGTPYQLDLVTPGNSPLRARFLKHIRHIWNFPMKALGLPHSGHLFIARTLNFGVRLAFSIIDVFAIVLPLYDPEGHTHEFQ